MLARIRIMKNPLTYIHIFVAANLFLNTLRHTSWNILPPSSGPIGRRLNRPMPMFSMKSQNARPVSHLSAGGIQAP